jgi:hypothetical protein
MAHAKINGNGNHVHQWNHRQQSPYGYCLSIHYAQVWLLLEVTEFFVARKEVFIMKANYNTDGQEC